MSQYDSNRKPGLMIQLRHTSVHRLISPPDTGEIRHALQERIKELNCLYGMAQLARKRPISMDKMLEDIVEILPPSWQYPEITCARIIFKDKEYRSRDYELTKWQQSSRIFLYHNCVGEVTVIYKEEKEQLFEGPFLSEERALIDAVAEWIGTMAMLIETEDQLKESNRQLMVERKALQETNAALRTVLARIEEEKKSIHSDIQANVTKILLPIINSLSIESPPAQRKYVSLLKENLENISSPFINQLSIHYSSLTPTEIRICNMIHSGMQTKDIARIRGVSASTISRHREHIRKKLGLTNQAINLTSYLQSTMSSDTKSSLI